MRCHLGVAHLVGWPEEMVGFGRIHAPPPRFPRTTRAPQMLEDTPLQSIIWKKAGEMVAKNAKGKYPAPVSIFECIKTGVEQAPRPNPRTHCAHSPAGAHLT